MTHIVNNLQIVVYIYSYHLNPAFDPTLRLGFSGPPPDSVFSSTVAAGRRFRGLTLPPLCNRVGVKLSTLVDPAGLLRDEVERQCRALRTFSTTTNVHRYPVAPRPIGDKQLCVGLATPLVPLLTPPDAKRARLTTATLDAIDVAGVLNPTKRRARACACFHLL